MLPHVLVRVNDDGTLTVRVDGEPFEPDEFAPPWRRSTFGALIDAVTQDRRVPVRVEVREVDGTAFTDIITPAKRRRPQPEPEEKRHEATAGASLVEVTGEGFVPGEDVAVAVIVAHTGATPTGDARALLDTAHLAEVGLTSTGAGEVILLGRVSGTQVIARPR
ncbi:hypothetical protein [Nesterenkonia alkaliphila]|uniref:hypothetical protein n=1 Tax=Nesterenkonia alkaliphila TaxID=1463631 RepID=UPI001E401E5C|nr:hypothetical protein [Nesterenkonia alkaliphila]